MLFGERERQREGGEGGGRREERKEGIEQSDKRGCGVGICSPKWKVWSLEGEVTQVGWGPFLHHLNYTNFNMVTHRN